MLAYHNNPKLKQDILEQLYTPDYKILMEDYETRFGIPEVLVYLQHAIFEELPTKVAIDWSIRFMAAIPVGADLSDIWREFAIWLLIDPVDGVIQYTTPGTDAHEVIMKIANLYQHGYTTQQMFAVIRDAYDHIYDASVATIAVYAAKASVVYFSAAEAVYAAHSSVAFCIKMANKLIELLQNSDKTRTENVSLS